MKFTSGNVFVAFVLCAKGISAYEVTSLIGIGIDRHFNPH